MGSSTCVVVQRSVVAAVMLGALSAAACSSRATLRITSPANGARVDSGRTVIVRVEASSAVRGVALLGSPVPGVWTLDARPFEFRIPIPPNTQPRKYTLTVVGASATGENITPAAIDIDVERPDLPVRIENDTLDMRLEHVGDRQRLLVDGIYADGSRVDLDYSNLTTYASEDPAIASVNSIGLVTAVAPGSTRITIMNGGRSVVVPVEVGENRSSNEGKP